MLLNICNAQNGLHTREPSAQKVESAEAKKLSSRAGRNPQWVPNTHCRPNTLSNTDRSHWILKTLLWGLIAILILQLGKLKLKVVFKRGQLAQDHHAGQHRAGSQSWTEATKPELSPPSWTTTHRYKAPPYAGHSDISIFWTLWEMGNGGKSGAFGFLWTRIQCPALPFLPATQQVMGMLVKLSRPQLPHL